MCPEMFDPQFEFEANENLPTKIENVWAEYNQLTLFLISERLKGDSFWKPFLDYLPSRNDTLFTIPNKKIHD